MDETELLDELGAEVELELEAELVEPVELELQRNGLQIRAAELQLAQVIVLLFHLRQTQRTLYDIVELVTPRVVLR